MTAEQRRLEEDREKRVAWKKWGPYLSERQWGTVREDYSDGGDAWNYFTHDQARSRASARRACSAFPSVFAMMTPRVGPSPGAANHSKEGSACVMPRGTSLAMPSAPRRGPRA